MSNPTGIDALFIIDDEYTDSAAMLHKKATRVQVIWDDYIKISEQIVGAQGSIAGSRAKAYSEFINVARQHLGYNILSTANEGMEDSKAYISMIDEADKALY